MQPETSRNGSGPVHLGDEARGEVNLADRSILTAHPKRSLVQPM